MQRYWIELLRLNIWRIEYGRIMPLEERATATRNSMRATRERLLKDRIVGLIKGLDLQSRTAATTSLRTIATAITASMTGTVGTNRATELSILPALNAQGNTQESVRPVPINASSAARQDTCGRIAHNGRRDRITITIWCQQESSP